MKKVASIFHALFVFVIPLYFMFFQGPITLTALIGLIMLWMLQILIMIITVLSDVLKHIDKED